MTIAAGFVYSGGVIVCADNQFTAGDVHKIGGRKTANYASSWGTVIAAFAGNSDYASSAFSECEHLKESKAFKKDPVQAFRGLLKRHYRDNVFTHPNYSTGDYDYWMLLGIYLNGDQSARLYRVFEGMVRPVTTFDCMGVGEHFGRDLLRCLHAFHMSDQTAISMTCYVLSHVENRTHYVGDKPSIEILRPDGHRVPQGEIGGLELTALHVANVGNWFIQECQQFLIRHFDGDMVRFTEQLARLDERAIYIKNLGDSMKATPPNQILPKPDSSSLRPWLE